MEWYVYYDDFNSKQIKKFNIFDHWKFKEDVEQDLRRYKSRAEFEKSLKMHLMHYFWSKSEWEILLSSWIGRANTVKIDIYDQVMLNWEVFVDYCWTH